MRWLWFCLGWVMVALGVIGALLPVTTRVTARPCACGASRVR